MQDALSTVKSCSLWALVCSSKTAVGSYDTCKTYILILCLYIAYCMA